MDRKCSDCGHEWTADLKATAEGSVKSAFFPGDKNKAFAEAKRKALANLDSEAQKRKKDVDEQVLCPVCSRFSTEAMDKHFREGYAAGLLSKYKTQKWYSFFTSLGLAGASLALGGAVVTDKVIQYVDERLELMFLFSFGIGSIVCAILFAQFLRKFIHLTKVHSKVERMVRSCSDDELLKLAVRCYHENNNSLRHGDTWWQVLSGEVSK